MADICTVHLPDMVVDCFTLSTQGIEGAAMIAREIQGHNEREIAILPVPMRIDRAQKDKADAGLTFAAKRFGGLPAGMSEEERSAVLGRSRGAVPVFLRLRGDARRLR